MAGTTVTVRYFAGAAAAAGAEQEQVSLDSTATAGTLLEQLSAQHGQGLTRVLAVCSVLVDGARATPATPLPDGGTVDLLPPFAGG